MGLLDALSGGLTTATNAATAQQQGQLQGGQLAMAMAMRQAEMQKQRAETEQAFANAARLRHQNNAPVLGEPGYNEAKGGEAGAVADAQVGPHVRQAVETAQGEDPIKRDFAAFQNNLTLTREKELENLKSALAPKYEPYQGYGPDGKPVMGPFNKQTGGFGQPSGLVGTQSVQQGEHLGNDFMRENGDLTKGIAPYMAVKVALAQAKAGNPAALKPALIDFASVADPKAQLRQGVMHEVMQVDPSVAGKWELAVDKLASGKLPASTITNIEKMVDQLHQTHAAAFEQRRAAFLKDSPMAKIPQTETLFKVPGIDGSSPTPNGTAAKTVTVNGKTFQLPD